MKLVLGFLLEGIQPGLQRYLSEATGEPGSIRPGDDVQGDVFEALFKLADEFNASFCLAAETSVWRSLEAFPATWSHAKRLQASGRLVPVLTHGEGAHVTFLPPGELQDELQNNRQASSRIFNLTADFQFGVWGSRWGVDTAKLKAALPGEISWAVCPVAQAPGTHSLYFQGDDAPALLPAETSASDLLQRLVSESVTGRITEENASRTFAEFLSMRAAETEKEDITVLFLLLEEKCSGTAATILSGALRNCLASLELSFILPQKLRQRFDPGPFQGGTQFGYYPAKSDLVRTDGLYPAYGKNTDLPAAYQPRSLMLRRPFLLWDSGRFLVRLLHFFWDGFQLPKSRGNAFLATASNLAVYQNDPSFLLRHAERASFWGPQSNLYKQKAAVVPVMHLVALFRAALNRGWVPNTPEPLPVTVPGALRACLGFQIDNPANAFERFAKESLPGGPTAPMSALLREAREHRLRAAEGVSRLESALAALARTPGAWFRAVDMLDVYAREFYRATTALERCLALFSDPLAAESFAKDFYSQISPSQVAVLLDRLDAAASKEVFGTPASHEKQRPAGVPGELHPW